MFVLRSTARPTLTSAVTAFLAAVVLSLSFTQIAAADDRDFGPFVLWNDSSRMALMPYGVAGGYGSTSWRRPIRQRPVNLGEIKQQWFAIYEGMTADGRHSMYSLKNRFSGRWCIHPWDWVSASRLLQGSCDSDTTADARTWVFEFAGGDWSDGVMLRSKQSGLYMDIEGKSTHKNALAVQAPGDFTSSSQIWHLHFV